MLFTCVCVCLLLKNIKNNSGVNFKLLPCGLNRYPLIMVSTDRTSSGMVSNHR